jgi:hypothetical protein
MNNPSCVTSRQAIFADFAHRALRAVASIPGAPLILLTGGLTTPAQLHAALSCDHANLLGIGRAAILRPDLPRLLTQVQPDSNTPFAPAPDQRLGERWVRILQRFPRVKLVVAGTAIAWYVVALRRLAQPGSFVQTANYSLGSLDGVWWVWAWFRPEILALRNTPPIFCVLTAVVLLASSILICVPQTRYGIEEHVKVENCRPILGFVYYVRREIKTALSCNRVHVD